jgi:hypothetical protein
MNGEIQVQEVLSKVREEGGEDPVLILINSYINRLVKQVERYQKSKSIEAEL